MRRKFVFAALLALMTFSLATPLFAAQSWNELVTGLQNREATHAQGMAILTDLRRTAPSGTEEQLWQMLWKGDARSRASAGVALMDKIFPDGNPAKWEQVSGFVTPAGRQPRQLMAMDGFFVAVSALASSQNGVDAAACLLEALGASEHGKIVFIDEMPAELAPVVASVVERTGMKGDWTCKNAHGKMPLTPVFEGNISREKAESDHMVYVDGFGALANNGKYAWDRDHGYLYEIMETSGQVWNM